MATIGWYGPLIDLSEASSHRGHFVQLLVLVHKTIPIQYKTSGGGKVIRTDIQVGDDTRPYFPISIWQKHMGSTLTAGNIILLQRWVPFSRMGVISNLPANMLIKKITYVPDHPFPMTLKIDVKVMKFGDVVEARIVQQSSIKCLVDTYEAIHSKGDNLMMTSHIGLATKEKLRKVIAWVLRAGPTLDKHASHNCKKNQNSANWKLPEEMQTKDCLSLLEVSNLNDSCNVSLFASIGEMFVPITASGEFDEERMFIRSRISSSYENLVEDLLCTGCQLCGAPLNSEFGSRIEQETPPLYCQKSSNRLHIVSCIYRPFLLYIWDEWTCIPVVVKNKAAELLVGNMKAESVYSSYKKQACRNEGINFYSLWLILLKALLGKNSPLKFKLRIDMTNNWDNGRFEMISVSLPH